MRSKAWRVPCPRCGREIELKPCPSNPGRVEGRCPCNPFGPVYETDQPNQKVEEVSEHDRSND